jgi:hypothetical protein
MVVAGVVANLKYREVKFKKRRKDEKKTYLRPKRHVWRRLGLFSSPLTSLVLSTA